MKDAGEWGIASWVAALAFFCIAVWEHYQDRSVAAFTFLCLSVPFFWAGSFVAWLKKKLALETEYDRQQQPDVALVWDWSEDQRKAQRLLGLLEADKSILVHNRSVQYIYNVRIEPIVVGHTLTFEAINEIAPGQQHVALGRWDDTSTLERNYTCFFDENEREVTDRGWVYKKTHNRGLSECFLKVPMAIRYDSNGITWQYQFDFDYDVGSESSFSKRSGQRIH